MLGTVYNNASWMNSAIVTFEPKIYRYCCCGTASVHDPRDVHDKERWIIFSNLTPELINRVATVWDCSQGVAKHFHGSLLYSKPNMDPKLSQFYVHTHSVTIVSLVIAFSILSYLAIMGTYTRLEYVWITLGLGGQFLGMQEVVIGSATMSKLVDNLLALTLLTSPFLINKRLLVYSVVTLLFIFTLQFAYGYCLLTGEPWSKYIFMIAALTFALQTVRLAT